MQSVRGFIVDKLNIQRGSYLYYNNYCYVCVGKFSFDAKDFVQFSNINFIFNQSLNIEYAIRKNETANNKNNMRNFWS